MRRIIRIALCMCLALMVTMSYSTFAFANKSITDDDKHPKVVHGGSGVGDWYYDTYGADKIVIDKADPSRYKDNRVVDIVTSGATPVEIAKRLGADPTVDGLTINLELYDRVTDFFDIGERENGQIVFKGGKNQKVTIQADVVKGLEKGDFLIMIINPDTGKLYLITPDNFDPETGMMDLTLPTYGAFSIIQKVPIVVRDIHPEEYLNEDVAESIEKLDDASYLELREWLDAFGVEDQKLEVADGVTVDVEDYDSADIIADIAVQVNKDKFHYQLSTKIWGNLFQDVNECDWERVLDYAGVDYDAEKIKKDPTSLTEIEPFVLEDSFVYHVDADTGEVSIAYEPEISFEIEDNYIDIKDIKVRNGLEDIKDHDIDKGMNRTEDVDNVDEVDDNIYKDDTSLKDSIIEPVYAKTSDGYTQEQLDILTFDVNDIDEKNTENLCMVMTSDMYVGMGPFMLFMPKEKNSFPWWWILIIIALLIVAFIIYRNRRNKNKKAA